MNDKAMDIINKAIQQDTRVCLTQYMVRRDTHNMLQWIKENKAKLIESYRSISPLTDEANDEEIIFAALKVITEDAVHGWKMLGMLCDLLGRAGGIITLEQALAPAEENFKKLEEDVKKNGTAFF